MLNHMGVRLMYLVRFCKEMRKCWGFCEKTRNWGVLKNVGIYGFFLG